MGKFEPSVETWLLQPLAAPEISSQDHTGQTIRLNEYRGNHVLLTFWLIASPESQQQLSDLQRNYSALAARNVRVLAINIDDPPAASAAREFVTKQSLPFPALTATPEISGVYNIIYRYLFDRRRDLQCPVSFFVDKNGMIFKVCQGFVKSEVVLRDVGSIPSSEAERVRRALPFPGALYEGNFERNDFTYGVALFQHGYLNQAAASFKQVIAAKPNQPDAYYNLGTLYLRQNSLDQARAYLEKSVELRPNYPEAFNNLGMIAAQQNQLEPAIRNFKRALELRPDYATALLNLGNVYRRQGDLGEAEKLLKRALELEPENPEVHYNLGMLSARQNRLPLATQYLAKAVELRPDYPDALNNLGVFFVQQERFPEAEQEFKTCIRLSPQFDQAYLNLARLYVVMKEKEKARQILQALLLQHPQHKLAQEALEMLN